MTTKDDVQDRRRGSARRLSECAADPPELFSGAPFSLEIPALYHVARLEEALGNRDAAREFYQRYLDRWGEADLPIPEVREAKARLAAL